MEAARRYADLSAESKLAAIGKLGRGIVQDDGAVYLVEKFFGSRCQCV